MYYTIKTIFVTDHGRYLVNEGWTKDRAEEIKYLLMAGYKPIGNYRYEYRYPDADDELKKILVTIE